MDMMTQGTEWSQIPASEIDLRLVVADMDGTLLTDEGTVPEDFWPLLGELTERGIVFVPASGRQYATLAELFDHAGYPLSYIAENGNLVMHHNEPIFTASLSEDTVRKGIEATRGAASQRNLGLVLCGQASAYVERGDEEFLAEAGKYYRKLEVVQDLTQVQDTFFKLAIHDFDDSQQAFDQIYAPFAEEHQVVISGQRWLDIMRTDIDKGRAVRALQERMAVTPAQTAVFGDYLNDLQMLTAGELSFAMANAHPQIKQAAKYAAPANTDHGVIRVLEHLLGS